jgi:hypothetical protein
MKTFLLITLLLLIYSCDLQNVRGNEPVLVYSVDSLTVTTINPELVRVHVWSTIPTPCYHFHHCGQTQVADTLRLELFIEADPDLVCVQVLSTLETELDIELGTGESLYLHFPGRGNDYRTFIHHP